MADKSPTPLNKKRFVYTLIFASLILGGFVYYVLSQAYQQVVKSHALIVAEIVAEHATVSRSIYAKNIVNKLTDDGFGPHVDSDSHAGFIPIPAQFLKMVGQLATETSNRLFEYKPVSKWNIEPTQGLDDDFLLWAWPQLEAQDRENPNGPIEWQPIWRFEDKGESRVLRFLYADPATSNTCATCHSAYEKTPEIMERRKKQGIATDKTWKQHQLLGALSITIPLNIVSEIANDQLKESTTLLTAIISLALVLIAWSTRRNVHQQSQLNYLDWAATHDQLTGLLNRRGFKRVCRENNTFDKSILCFIDLDEFKPINDTYGHKAGDLLLKAIADSLLKVTRKGDCVIRLGGDEFAIVFYDCTLEDAEHEGQRILHAICSSSITINGKKISISASIGITEIDNTEGSLKLALEEADAASYMAKNQGRNQVVIAPQARKKEIE